MSNPSEILPCPFCGGPPEVFEADHGNVRIECMWCDANRVSSKDCAAEGWNRRALEGRPSLEPSSFELGRAHGITQVVDSIAEHPEKWFPHQNRAQAGAVQRPAGEDERYIELTRAIGELSMAMGSPCVGGSFPRSVESETVRLAITRLAETQRTAAGEGE